MKMNIAVCDDQKECNAKLSHMLKRCLKQMDINCRITEYTSGAELSKAYAPGLFDFVFLDVQMPSLNGLETAERIRSKDLNVDIVFVTNMSDQMYMGFNYNAKGFLVKDISQEQINTLMHRLITEMRRRDDVGIYPIKLKFNNGDVLLQLSEVLYFESRDKYVIAKTADGDFEFRKQLSVVEKDIDGKGFIRINRSLPVNASYVFNSFGNFIVLRGSEEELPIGNNYKASVRKAIRMKR